MNCPRQPVVAPNDAVQVGPGTTLATTVCFYATEGGRVTVKPAVLDPEEAGIVAQRLRVVHPVDPLPHCANADVVRAAQLWVTAASPTGGRAFAPITVGIGACSYVSYSQDVFGSVDPGLAAVLVRAQSSAVTV
jgi:hypothetical protein